MAAGRHVHSVEEVVVAPDLLEGAPFALAAALDVESGGVLGVVALAADEGLHPVVGDERDVVAVVLGARVLDPPEVGGRELLPGRVLYGEVAHRLQHLRHLNHLPHFSLLAFARRQSPELGFGAAKTLERENEEGRRNGDEIARSGTKILFSASCGE